MNSLLRKKSNAVSNITQILCNKPKQIISFEPTKCVTEDWVNSLELEKIRRRKQTDSVIQMKHTIDSMISKGAYVGPHCKIVLLQQYVSQRSGPALLEETIDEIINMGSAIPEDLFSAILIRISGTENYKKYALQYIASGCNIENRDFRNAAALHFCKHHKNPRYAAEMLGNSIPAAGTLRAIASCFNSYDCASKFIYETIESRDWGLSRTDFRVISSLLGKVDSFQEISNLISQGKDLSINDKIIITTTAIDSCRRLTLYDEAIEIIKSVDHSKYITLEYLTAVSKLCHQACERVSDVFWLTAWTLISLLQVVCKNAPPFVCVMHLVMLCIKFKNVENMETIFNLFTDLRMRISSNLKTHINEAYKACGRPVPEFEGRATVSPRAFPALYKSS